MLSAELIATLRLSKPELTRILEEVRNRREACGDEGRRQDQRWWYGKALSITVCMANDRTQSMAALGMDISQSGVGLLVGSFIYPESKLVAILPSRISDEEHHIEGTARSCSHFYSRWHRVGIQFDTLLDPAEFVQAKAA